MCANIVQLKSEETAVLQKSVDSAVHLQPDTLTTSFNCEYAIFG